MDTQYTKLKILGYSFVARSKSWEIFAKHIEYGTDTHIENFAITLPNKKEIEDHFEWNEGFEMERIKYHLFEE